ncbi:type IX secretion system plug protein [Sphingobacterium hungaricum]
MKQVIFLFFLAILCCGNASAQRKKRNVKEEIRSPKQELVYQDKNYLPTIKSVQFSPLGKEGDLPLISLNSDEKLNLVFDDLRADVRNFYFSIEHCNYNWEPSRVSPLEYAAGYNEDRIENFTSSKSTAQAYTNYNLTFPTEYVKPKISGNYLLKVYEDADKNRLILTRKFYVYRDLIQVQASLLQSPNVNNRASHQKINVTIKTNALTITNPQRDIHVVAIQNRRNDYQLETVDPLFIGNNEVRYEKTETLDFKGNKEFRYVDLRSFRLAAATIKNIRQDSIPYVTLTVDEDESGISYASTFDENGKFYIRNLDLEDDAANSSDYANVEFSLKTNQQPKGKIYLAGAFNNFIPSEEFELEKDEASLVWKLTTKLKQGLYDYDYIFVDENGKSFTDTFSNSHFETGNSYQILIYNRRPGTYWDELSGYSEITTNKKQN